MPLPHELLCTLRMFAAPRSAHSRNSTRLAKITNNGSFRRSTHRNFSSSKTNQSDRVQTPSTSSSPQLSQQFSNDDRSYSSPVMLTLGVFGRMFRIAVYGSVVVVLTTVTFWTGSHAYVEYIDLGRAFPFVDSAETAGWDEDDEQTCWSAGHLKTGGTDTRLPLLARVAIRAAYMAQRYGGGPLPSATNNQGQQQVGGQLISQHSESISVPDAGYLTAEHYLLQALERAKTAGIVLPDRSAVELEERLAGVRERMAGSMGLSNARSTHLRIWNALQKVDDSMEPEWVHRQRLKTARRIGEVGFRLATESLSSGAQRSEELRLAEQHLLWCINGAINGNSTTEIAPSKTDLGLPSVEGFTNLKPSVQRTMLGALTSLTALYAASNQLKKANATAEIGIACESAKENKQDSFPQRLHLSSIEARHSLLLAYQGEVQRALGVSEPLCLETLEKSVKVAESASSMLSPLAPVSSEISIRAIGVALMGNAMQKERERLRRKTKETDLDARSAACLSSTLSGLIHELGRVKSRTSAWCGGDAEAMKMYTAALAFASASNTREVFTGQLPKGNHIDGSGYRRAWNSYVRVRERLEA